ncbi:MAG TPA: glycosyltransferase 87 family protein [Gaiellaceae bacterium]|nr:glycosyltransferase 87 family protein [Gaiellaceae bacterium]
MHALAGRFRFPVAVTVAGLAGVGVIERGSLGDYPSDAGPAIRALVGGHVHQALAVQPLMGSLAVLVRVPFALLATALGGGDLAVYRAGAIPCVAALAVLGVALVRMTDASRWSDALLIPALAVLTPVSIAAFTYGHPEEALAAALCVGAAVAAGRRAILAGILLGLALGTKQWTVLAIAPVLLATERGSRLKLIAAAAPLAVLFTLPLVADVGAAQNVAQSTHIASRETMWFLVAHPTQLHLQLGPGLPSSVTTYPLDAWVAALSHPLIVALSPLLTVLVWKRRDVPGAPLALLALVFLFRCVLDPADNEYYHLPLVLSLLAYETVGCRAPRRIPAATFFTVVGLWLTSNVLDMRGAPPQLTNAVYLTCMSVVAVYLLHALWLPALGRRFAFPAAPALARHRT